MNDVFVFILGLFVGLVAWALYAHMVWPLLVGTVLLGAAAIAWDKADGGQK